MRPICGSGRRAGLFAYSPFRFAHSLRSFAFSISTRWRDGLIAMCAVSVSSFSRHRLANGVGASARSCGGRRVGCVICRMRSRMSAIAAMAAGDDGTGRTERDGTIGGVPAFLDDFDRRRRRADGDTRDGTNGRGDSRRGRRFLCYAPFSVAHLRRRVVASGFFFLSFAPVRLACSSLSVSARLVSFPSSGALSYRARRWTKSPRRVGGMIWRLVPRPVLSVPSLRSRLISPYRLAGGLRAPFLSAHFPYSLCSSSFVRGGGRIVFPHSLRSSRLSSRLLRLVGSVSCLFFAVCFSSRLARQFALVSPSRFARRLVYRFVRVISFGGPPVVSLLCRPSCSLLFSSLRLARLCLMTVGGGWWLVFLILSYPYSLSSPSSSDCAVAATGWALRRWTIRGTCRFRQLDFIPSGEGDGDDDVDNAAGVGEHKYGDEAIRGNRGERQRCRR